MPTKPKLVLAKNPRNSRAWKTRPERNMQKPPRTRVIKAEQCTVGLNDPLTETRLRKATRVDIDSPVVKAQLQDRRCAQLCNHLPSVPEHTTIEGSTKPKLPNGLLLLHLLAVRLLLLQTRVVEAGLQVCIGLLRAERYPGRMGHPGGKLLVQGTVHLHC